jgi:hypothetical protein
MTDTLGRRMRVVVAAVWIGCRVAALVAAPVAVWIDAVDAASGCHCTHGADATCPMHHKAAGGTRVCAMQAAGDWATTTVESMLGLAAPHALHVALDEPRAVERVSEIGCASISFPAVPPEPPPPRT